MVRLEMSPHAPARLARRFSPLVMAAAMTACCKPQQTGEVVTSGNVPQLAPVPTAVVKPPVSAIGKISQAIVDSGSIPTGYKGAEGKVKVDPKSGAIFVAQDASGNDVGFFVEFMPVSVGDSKTLSFNIKGQVFQKQGWAKYGSVQVLDKSGQRFVLRELCQSVWDDCTDQLVVDISTGKTLEIKLPSELKDLKRFEMVFVGEAKVFQGLTVDTIDLK